MPFNHDLITPAIAQLMYCPLFHMFLKECWSLNCGDILNLIYREQFGFLRGSSASYAGISLASTITTAINQHAEAHLVDLDINGAFDSVWWKGLLAHLWSVGFQGKLYLCDCYIRVVTPSDSSDLLLVFPGGNMVSSFI